MGNNSGKPGERSIRVNDADLPDLQRAFEQIGGGKKIKEHELTVIFYIFILQFLENRSCFFIEFLEQPHLSILTERYLPLLIYSGQS